MTSIENFATQPFITALKSFFGELKVPINPLQDLPILPVDIFGENYKSDNKTHQLIDEVYVVGTVDDSAFDAIETKTEAEINTADYDFILILGIKLKIVEGKNPSRGQLAELTRLANKAFNTNEKGNPVTIVFKYGSQLALANTERQTYTQNWRAGEKIGKVTLLRDIDFTKPHTGHTRILSELVISKAGKNTVESYETLYKYWQSVLSVSILNKAFYGELQNWYFWAIKEVTFPNAPIRLDFSSDLEYDEALKEHKAKNVIRLLTRILFIWFIKEKGLIPEEIFNEKELGNKILKEFVPQKPEGLFVTGKQSSKYYRAVLQNLFFATLNQTRGNRTFRGDGQHQNVTQLMRYKTYFKNANYFIELMEKTVPFMNGGLFECLDKPHTNLKGPQGGDRIIYVDGFSDRADNDLIVPDFLFFDADEEVDLSTDFGSDKRKKEKTRGLIAILKSYKFTITENTPIDEDVALDPELLGKVFENLLASYNPETKTTARKQTGSFYTPREIVNYMVDESLIAYLKNELLKETTGVTEFGKKQIAMFGNEVKKGQLGLETRVDDNPFVGHEEDLDLNLHQLISYSDAQPFTDERHKKQIIKALDACNILDPACGSGAYPMGILQKMVHILHKIDPNNTEWKNRQLKRVNNAITELEQIDDADTRNSSIKELEAQKKDIEESFANNELDYGRKLYLIENCIFGVDIQPIATQISKLRFFISLVVDQKVDADKDNFGIRPLPNLETKFVAANTLIGIEKPKKGQFTGSLFDKQDVKKLEKELKKVRKDLFSAKTSTRKRTLREADKTLREQMSNLLVDEYGNATATLLANWDPYDQNTSSPFFDKEWMFDITDGFDIVIGNPPYVSAPAMVNNYAILRQAIIDSKKFSTLYQKWDLYIPFIEIGLQLLIENGIFTMIVPYPLSSQTYGMKLRELILNKYNLFELVDLNGVKVFENATVSNCIPFISKSKPSLSCSISKCGENGHIYKEFIQTFTDLVQDKSTLVWNLTSEKRQSNRHSNLNILGDYCYISTGMVLNADETTAKGEFNKDDLISEDYDEIHCRKYIEAKDIERYNVKKVRYLEYNTERCPGKLRRPTFRELYEMPKLMFNRLGNLMVIFDDLTKFLHSDSMYCAVLWKDLENVYNKSISTSIKRYSNYSRKEMNTFSENIDLKYLLSVLNSKYASILLSNLRGGDYHIYPEHIRNLPIPKITIEAQLPFITLVDKILEGKKERIDTLAYEAEIDLRVYKLYELTYAEVLVVEPGFRMSEAEYEGFVS